MGAEEDRIKACPWCGNPVEVSCWHHRRGMDGSVPSELLPRSEVIELLKAQIEDKKEELNDAVSTLRDVEKPRKPHPSVPYYDPLLGPCVCSICEEANRLLSISHRMQGERDGQDNHSGTPSVGEVDNSSESIDQGEGSNG